MPYSVAFQDHFANPRNVGSLEDATHTAEETNPVCGDRLHLFLRVHNNRIEAARFLAYGCPPTIACGSALAEMIEGMTLEEAARLSKQQLADALDGLPSRKTHAAHLALETLRAAIAG